MEVMARYGGGADVAWKMGRIMLKYRPIAPKPVTGGAAVTVGSVDVKSNGSGRGKRKGCLRAAAGRRGRKRSRKVASGVSLEDVEAKKANDNSNGFLPSPTTEVVTLPLMPVTPERKEEPPVGTPSPVVSDGRVAADFWGKTCTHQPYASVLDRNGEKERERKPAMLPPDRYRISSSGLPGRIASGAQNNFLESAANDDGDSSSGGAKILTPHRPIWMVGSWVTVESVTGTWRDGEFPLPTLEYDTCPSFVSDPFDRVAWTNAAYRRMVVGSSTGGGDEVEEEEVIRVALVTRGMVPQGSDTGFTCRARVKHVCRDGGKVVSMIVPCDVWRLGGGRLAWRLDVKAALSLSLGCEV